MPGSGQGVVEDVQRRKQATWKDAPVLLNITLPASVNYIRLHNVGKLITFVHSFSPQFPELWRARALLLCFLARKKKKSMALGSPADSEMLPY